MATRPPKSRPQGGGRQRAQEAKVWAAKQQLTAFDIPPVPKTNLFAPGAIKVPTVGIAPSPKVTPQQAAKADRAKLAVQAKLAEQTLVPGRSGQARAALASTLTDAEKKKLRDRTVLPPPPPPHRLV